MQWHIQVLRVIEITGPRGVKVPFGRKLLDQITKADVEALRRVRREHDPRAKGGEAGCNRILSRLRHMFSWAIGERIMDHTPFKRHGVTVIKLNGAAEAPRVRRLEEGEETDVPVYERDRLQPGMAFPGPGLVLEYSSTVWVPVGAMLSVDPWGSLIMDTGA